MIIFVELTATEFVDPAPENIILTSLNDENLPLNTICCPSLIEVFPLTVRSLSLVIEPCIFFAVDLLLSLSDLA